MTITSPDNPGLKAVRKLRRAAERARSGTFVVEGEDLLAAADAAGWEPVRRFCAAGSGLDGEAVEPDLLAEASALGSGTRALGIYRQRWAAAPAGPLCVYLHAVGDPGNVGAVLRSAAAFGAASVALGPGCADPYGPKAARASMGAIFAVPVARAAPTALPGTTVALDAGAQEGLRGPAEEPITLLVGAERAGLPADVVAGCDRAARIPIATESLNAAMAATVGLYELTRMARR